MIMPPEQKGKTTELTREERRVRRLLRREKQRHDNIGRAAKMHAARLRMEADHGKSAAGLKASAYVGCSGWFYWKWRGLFYPDGLPTGEWFRHYARHLHSVEINASFYSWPTVANVNAWRRLPGKREFVYTVKACELITHIKRFRGHKNTHHGFWHDRRYPGRPNGVLSIPASTKSSLYKGAANCDSQPTRSSKAQRR
jgi:hypothetical protein